MIIGLAFAALLYYREKKVNAVTQHKNWIKYILFAIRTLLVSLLCFLLLQPVIRQSYFEKLKPSIAVLIDNSSSVKTNVNEQKLQNIQEEIKKALDNFNSNFNIQYFSFGSQFSQNKQANFTEKQTNFERAFEGLEKEYANKNLSAVLLLSDGIDNAGEFSMQQVSNLKTPVFAIGIGDTTPQKDLAIVRALYNEIAYVNEPINIQIECSASDAQYHKSQLNFAVNGKNISSKSVDINSNIYENTFDFNFTPTQTGIYQLNFTVNSVEGERNTLNNKKQIVLNVIDAKKKVLFIIAQPQPDIAALRNAITNNTKFDTEVRFFNDNINLDHVDLVVFYKSSMNGIEAQRIIQQLNARNISRFFIEGDGILPNTFNSLQNTVQANFKAKALNEVFTIINPDFQNFEISSAYKSATNVYPPLFAPFIETKLSPASKVIFYQKIGSVSTKNPLLIADDNSNYKTGVFLAEGIWKSRMAHFSRFSNHTDFDAFWASLFQFFATKNDKRKFKVWSEKQVFSDFEPINLNAELYNDNYNLVNTPEVNITLKNNAQSYNFIFDRTENAYTFNTESLPEGDYNYSANTVFNGKKYSQEGKFSIVKSDTENSWLTANHNMLKLMANESKGHFYTEKNIQALANDLSQLNGGKDITYTYYRNKMLIDNPWFLALLLGLLALEWFIRKYLGTY